MELRNKVLPSVIAFACGVLIALLFSGTAAAGSWTQKIIGGFGDTFNREVRSMAVYNGRLYVGTANNHGCEVWTYDGSAWNQVVGQDPPGTAGTGPGFGNADNSVAMSMAVYESRLYVGTSNFNLGCEVWAYDGSAWNQVVGQDPAGTAGTGHGFGDGSKYHVTSMVVFDSRLYAGTWSSALFGCALWRYDGNVWTPVVGVGAFVPPGFGDPENYAIVSMAVLGSDLFAGVANDNLGCQVWRYDGTDWTSMVGVGAVLSSGFGNPANKEANSMAVFQSQLFVGTYNFNGCEVWCYDGTGWYQVVGGTIAAPIGPGFGDPENKYAYDMAVYDSRLHVSTDNQPGGGEVWTYDGTRDGWTQVVGQGPPGTLGTGPGFGDPDNIFISTMAEFNSRLYLGTVNGADGCEVWSTKSSTTWYLAEGATAGGYETWVLVQNPNPFPANVDIRFQTGEGEVPGPVGVIPAQSRKTYLVNSYVNTFDVSTRVIADADVVCERAVYWAPSEDGTRVVGHDSIGVVNPASTWYLAEGATTGGFETWVLVQNPNAVPVNIDMVFQTGSGEVKGPRETIPARSRRSYLVNNWVKTFDVSTKVTSTTPGENIICERAVYWTPEGTALKMMGHDSIGVVSPAPVWYLAEGATDGGFETWVLVQNPNPFPVAVDIRYQTGEGEVQGPQGTITARSRKSFRANDTVTDFNVSTKVTSTTPGGYVICERAVYWIPEGTTQRVIGHDSIGVRAGSATWNLAEGATTGGFETWVLVQNPNDVPVDIDMRFQTASGPEQGPVDSIPPRSRNTYRVNDWVETFDVSTKVTSTTPGKNIICERAVYWSPPGSERILGTDSIGYDP